MDDTKAIAWIDAEYQRAIDRLGARGHDLRVQQVIRDTVASAYRAGRANAWNNVYPVSTVAEMLGVTTAHVHLLSRKHGIGTIIGRERLFRDEDVQALRAIPDRRRRDVS